MSAFSRRVAACFSSGVTVNPSTERLSISAAPAAQAVQSLAYASSITPDPSSGEVISIGTLSGDIVINNPTISTPGQLLEFHFQQPVGGGRAVTFGSYFQQGGSAMVARSSSAWSTVRYRCLTSTFWALQTGLADTQTQFDVAVYKGSLPTETPGTTSVPRAYARVDSPLIVKTAYIDVDTTPTSTLGVTIRKNGSSSGQIVLSLAPGAFSASASVAAMTLGISDYVQAWVTAPGGAANLSVSLVGVAP